MFGHGACFVFVWLFISKVPLAYCVLPNLISDRSKSSRMSCFLFGRRSLLHFWVILPFRKRPHPILDCAAKASFRRISLGRSVLGKGGVWRGVSLRSWRLLKNVIPWSIAAHISSCTSNCFCSSYRLSEDSFLLMVAPIPGQVSMCFQSSSSCWQKQQFKILPWFCWCCMFVHQKLKISFVRVGCRAVGVLLKAIVKDFHVVSSMCFGSTLLSLWHTLPVWVDGSCELHFLLFWMSLFGPVGRAKYIVLGSVGCLDET
jgi:hypothetical protein